MKILAANLIISSNLLRSIGGDNKHWRRASQKCQH